MKSAAILPSTKRLEKTTYQGPGVDGLKSRHINAGVWCNIATPEREDLEHGKARQTCAVVIRASSETHRISDAHGLIDFAFTRRSLELRADSGEY